MQLVIVETKARRWLAESARENPLNEAEPCGLPLWRAPHAIAPRAVRTAGPGWFRFRTFFFSALALTAGCSGELGCDLDGTTRKLGGAGLTDCGLAEFGDTSVVDRCAVVAEKTRATFRAMYERKDGSLEAVVHAPGDRYFALRASTEGDDVKRAECGGASIVTEGSRQFVKCDDRGEFSDACD